MTRKTGHIGPVPTTPCSGDLTEDTSAPLVLAELRKATKVTQMIHALEGR